MPTSDLTLHMHPLASYCWKVVMALRENGTPFTEAMVAGDPKQNERLSAIWAVGKMPVLEDAGRGVAVPETSIIIEYLDRHHPGPMPMIPADPEAAREARLWDRFADLYLSTPMQKIVADRIRPEDQRDAYGVAEARAQLDIAYGMLERRMAGRQWLAGEAFGLADCAALPPLFYLEAIHPFRATHPAIAAYLDRLLERPSVREVIRAAQPFFQYFPFNEALDPRFLGPDF